VRNENPNRAFHVLEQLHVLPNITYLAKIRNTEELDAHWIGEHGGEEHAEAGHGETKPAHAADSTLPSATKPVESGH
jgi:hypothetical protein